MSERLDQLGIAENSKSAVALAELDLVRGAWVFARLAFCWMSVTAHRIGEADKPSARVYTGGSDWEDYETVLVTILCCSKRVGCLGQHTIVKG